MSALRRPYLVAVATWEPRKNLARLLQAFVALKRNGQLADHQLAITDHLLSIGSYMYISAGCFRR